MNFCNHLNQLEYSFNLAIYGYEYLPSNTKSHEQTRTSDETIREGTSNIPLIVFCAMRFFTTITLLVSQSGINTSMLKMFKFLLSHFLRTIDPILHARRIILTAVTKYGNIGNNSDE